MINYSFFVKFNSIDRYSTYLEDNQNVMKFLKIITTVHKTRTNLAILVENSKITD